jgi:glycosyltransferase involved in cell wall biosynthesis
MRILITLPWARRLGGAEAMIQAVFDGAGEHELEPVFFEQGPWAAELESLGLRVEVIDAGRIRRADRWCATVLRLARLMRRRQPELILNWAPKTQLYGAPAAALAGMAERVVWWQHGIPTDGWIDRCASALPALAVGCSSRASAAAQARLAPGRRTFVVAPGSRDPYARVEGDSHAYAPGGPRPRADGEQNIRADGDLDAYANGNPQTNGAAGALTLPSGVAVVGIVGRMEPWKGQDRLLEAQALLRERGLPCHLLIVGGDAYDLSPEYARSLPELVQELSLGDAVTMTGHVADAGPYIDRMDVLVNASEGEPFGIVLIEGMSRGVPVVAVDSGGPAEIVQAGRTGALARAGDPVSLADALEPLLASPALRERLGRGGRERFEREYTDGAMRERFFERLQGLRMTQSDAGGQPVTIVAHDVGAVGGMERQLSELVLGLRHAGHPVAVIARTCRLPVEAGVTFHRVPGPSRPFLLAYPWFLLAGSLLLRRHRRGVVQATGAIVLGSVDSVSVHCCHRAYRAMPGRPTMLFRLYGAAVGALKRGGEWLCFRTNRASSIVCVSEGVAEEVRSYYPKLAGRVVAIHNGVDAQAFAPGRHVADAQALRAELGIAAGRRVAAFVGGDWEHKGLRHAIEALAQAPGWDLLVAGRGHPELYRQLAGSLGVAGAVHWLGVVRDIERVYELADAFVMPSSYETFSLVTFEAAASAVPIVASDVNGVRELIVDGESGFLVPAEASAIAERLRLIEADPALAARLGHTARQAALRFSWEAMVSSHRRLFARLAGSGQPS